MNCRSSHSKLLTVGMNMLLLLPIYWYALSFEDFQQRSASRKYRKRMKKMSWNRENWERQKEEKMEKNKEIEDILWINWVLSARSSRPESWRCRATLPDRYDLEVGSTVLLSWERKRSVDSFCLLSSGGIDVLFFQYLFSNRTLHQWQQGDVVS